MKDVRKDFRNFFKIELRFNESNFLCFSVGPPFCHTSTCPIRCSFGTLQQFPGGPLLPMQLIFSKPPWRLWLKDSSNPIMTLSRLNLDLGFFFLFRIAFRYTWLIRHYPKHLRPTQAHQAHLDALGSLRPTQAHWTHLDAFDPLRLTQAHLGPFWHTLAHLGLPSLAQVTFLAHVTCPTWLS